MKISKLAQNLKGSEIIKIAGEVKAMIANNELVFNQTIGDFDSSIFQIPAELKENILAAYHNDETNYPQSNGMEVLRESVSNYLYEHLKLQYTKEEILISGGARPLIYALYQTILDPEDYVLYPVPSWNNDAYTYLSRDQGIIVPTRAENNFMPTALDLGPHIKRANLLALCSPLNPTGTTFSYEDLSEISQMVVKENRRRARLDIKPLYILYDQIYWQLCYGDTVHYNPVELEPDLKDYTIFVDGISKAFAATGLRVGWAFGPVQVINKMKALLSHVGAWAPRAEQIATASFLSNAPAVSGYLEGIKSMLSERLQAFYTGFQALEEQGLPVHAIEPEAALYLTVQFDLVGKTTEDDKELHSIEAVTAYLLQEAKLALVPFYAFGAERDVNWFRLSVGTAKTEDIPKIMEFLETALRKLS